MNTLSQLFELLAKSALVLTMAALLAASWHRASAAQRHTLWLAAFVALLLLPLSKLTAPRWRLPGSAEAPTVIMTVAPAIADTAPDAIAAIAAPAPVRAWRWPEPAQLLTGLWLGGVAALLGYRLLGSVQIARLRRRSTPLDDTRVLALARTAAAELDLADRYQIRHALAARVPCTWGVRRPVILLPTAALQWNETRLLAALRHEFGHIARRDYLTRWLGHVICALYWPNPLVWLAARSLHKAQEQACDDLVLRAGTPAPDYAALLFEAASASGQRGLLLRHAVAMARPSTLEGRVLAIVDETRDRRPAGRAGAVASAFVVVATLGLSALAQVASEAPAAPAPAVAGAGAQILIEAKFVEVGADKWPEARTGSVTTKTSEQTTAMLGDLGLRSGVDLLSAPRILTTSGQAARIYIGNEEKLPEGAQPPTKSVGITLDVVPTLAGGAIQLAAKAKFVSRRATADAVGAPAFHERTSAASVSLPPGQTIVFGAGAGDKPDREVLIFITASVVVPDAATGAPAIPGSRSTAAPSGTLLTKEFRIPRGVFEKMEPAGRPLPTDEKVDARTFLERQGVKLSSTDSAVYLPSRIRLIVRTTQENHDLIEQLLERTMAALSSEEREIMDAEIKASFLAELPPDERKTVEAEMRAPVSAPTLSAAKNPSPAAHGNVAGGPVVIDPSFSYADTAKIILPKLEFRGATVDECVEFLRRKSRDLDPTGRGVNFVLKADKETSDRRITLSLANIPLSEAIRYVGSLANLEVVYEPHAIVLRPPFATAKAAFGAQPIDITAEEMQFANGVAVASGDVKLTYGNSRVSANKLSYDPTTRSVRTEGASKVELDHPAVPGLPGAALPDAAAKPLAIEEKAKAIIIPKLEFRETTLEESVDFLMKRSRELDPEKKGIAISLPKDLPTAQSDVRITISLTNIPVLEALKYITNLANTKYKVTEAAFVIVPLTPEAALRP